MRYNIILSLAFITLVTALPKKIFGNNLNGNPSYKADSLLEAGNYEAAYTEWEKVVNSLANGDSLTLIAKSKMYYSLGANQSTKQNYSAAIEAYSTAATIAKQLNLKKYSPYLKKLYTGYYHAAAYSGNWQKALSISEEGYSLFYKYLEGKLKADYIYDLGFLHDKNGNYFDAIEKYEASISVLQSIDDAPLFDIGLAYNNLSTNYKQMGFFTARLNCLLNAKKYWEKDAKNIDYTYFTTLYGNLLKVYLEYGDLYLAENMLNKVDSILSKKEHPISQKINQHRLHIDFLTADFQTEAAVSRLDRLIQLFKSADKTTQQTYISHLLSGFHSIIDYLSDNNQADRAEKYLQLGLNLAKEYDNLYYQMVLNSEYSKIADLRNNSLHEIIHYLDEALKINKVANIGQENLMTLNLRKAYHYQQFGKTDSSKKYIQLAFSYLDSFNESSLFKLNESNFIKQHSIYIIRALVNAADYYHSFYETDQNKEDIELSLHLYKLAAKAFDYYYQNGNYNPSLNNLNIRIQEGIYTALHLLNHKLNANLLDLIEKNNSQTLRKEFEAKQERFTAIPADLLNKRNLRFSKLQALKEKVKAFPDSSSLVKMKEETELEINKINSEIEQVDARYDKFYSNEISISSIQNQLTNKELIVKYIQGKERYFAILINKNSIELIAIGNRKKIDSAITDYHAKIQRINSDIVAASQSCYKLIVSPFKESLASSDHLIIIPDGKLNYLSFESLVSDENNDYLIQHHEVSYSPSLSLWYLTNRSKRSVNENKKLIAAFAPVYSDSYYSQSRKANSNRLENIEGATKEAKAIVDSYGGDLYLSNNASKQDFVKQANNYSIFHLAMHTIYDDEESENSKLVFQNEETMSFNELYNLDFPAELVVLSACNTGIGELKAGEGMQSLSQALVYSGVNSSVYSLWPVPDRETAQIMQLFYENLKNGATKSAALAKAKRDFLENNPLHQHPYFWAGFVVQGNQDAIVESSNSLVYWLIFGFSIILFTVLFWRKINSL